MIKEINELDDLELENLRSLYIEYFNSYADSQVEGFTSNIKSKLEKINSDIYADDMISKIKGNTRIGLAYMEDLDILSFIVGRVYRDREGWISHFYIDPSLTSLKKHQIMLKMYEALLNKMKENGVDRITTEATYNEYALLDFLETNDFVAKENLEDNSVEYGKRI